MTYPTKDSFEFDFESQTDYPNWTPAETKAKLNARGEELRLALNNLVNILSSTGEDNWLYQQIANAILGQVADGSLTDVKLSDAEGQIKEIVTLHLSNTINPHSVTASQTGAIPLSQKGEVNGVATLDSSSKVPITQLGYVARTASGSYSGTGATTMSISLGFQPKFVHLHEGTGSSVGDGFYVSGHNGTNMASSGHYESTSVTMVSSGFTTDRNASGVVYTYFAIS